MAFASLPRVGEPHPSAHMAHGLPRELARLFAPVRDDVANQGRIVEILLGALPDGALFCEHRIDHRLLAFEATDAGGAAALVRPLAGLLIAVDEVELPDRALVGITRIVALHPGRVGRHGTDF